MDGLQRTTQLAESWWQSFYYCFSLNPASLICESFWAKAIGAFIAIGAVAVVAGIWKYIDYRRKYAAAVREEWLREQADEVGIKEATWDGDKAYQAELPDDEVLARVRAGIEQRKREMNAPTSAG
jgi:hypothetical protein